MIAENMATTRDKGTFVTQMGSYEAVSKDDEDYDHQIGRLLDNFAEAPETTNQIDLQIPIEINWVVPTERAFIYIKTVNCYSQRGKIVLLTNQRMYQQRL